MKRLLLAIFVFFVATSQVHAIVDPLSVPNNRYGMHVADTNDIADVAPLVNSNGGDWGYVTVVLSDADRDLGRWQNIFRQMRQLHLIPLVRLGTHVEAAAWTKPTTQSIKEAAEMLNKLVWPTQNRYIIFYNEPNHANEWGNALDPEGYAAILADGAKAFKGVSEDFFILPAGLDVSASNVAGTMDAGAYLNRMVSAKPEILTLIDGWNSHSYPNPGFSGSPNAYGRGTLRSYEWELSQLRAMGLIRDLPIFITETGWWHSEGKTRSGGLTPEQVGEYMKTAAESAWNDPHIVAITPFVFNYQDVPFDHFSFKKLGVNEYYPHYDAYKNLAKIKGKPKRIERYTLQAPFIPQTIVAGSVYTLTATIKNDGQAILSASEGYDVGLGHESSSGFSVLSEPLPSIEPERMGDIAVHLKTPADAGFGKVALVIMHDGQEIPMETREVTLIPPPDLEIRAKLGWRKTSDADNVTVLVYKDDEVIHKYQNLSLKQGILTVEQLTNVIPGQKYRIVMLVPYYLPRQTIQKIESGKTLVTFKRFFPLDMDKDGAFTGKDLLELFKQPPHDVWQRFVGP